MFRRISVAVAILLVSGATAQAEDEDYERGGPYIGAAGTWAIYTGAENHLGDEGLASVDVDEPLGVNARAGYRIYPALAAELQFEWLSKANIKASGSNIADLDSWSLTANAKGYFLYRLMHDLAIARVQPFALLGLGLMHSKIDSKLGGLEGTNNESFAARLGAGIDLYITPNILGSLDFSYVIPTNRDLEGLDYVAFGWGLQYRF